MYATLANLLCWIVFYSLWNKVARSCSAARAVQIVWFSHDALRQSLQDEEARSSDADVELPFFPLEAPEELQARRIDQWLRNEDMPGPRQRPKRQGPTVFESNSNTIPGGTWQERLEEMCRMTHIHPPVFNIQSDRRGGRTAWCCIVTVQGQNICSRYWYDGRHIQNSREDAAEIALKYLDSVKTDH